MKSYKRWQIEGTLTTVTNLHIGSGETTHHDALTNDDKPVEVEAVIKDYREKPYLTGSAIKGNIRSWFESCYVKVDHAKLCLHTLDRLFGSRDFEKSELIAENPNKPKAIAGHAEFCNAYLGGDNLSIPESAIEGEQIRDYLLKGNIISFKENKLIFNQNIEYLKKRLSELKENDPNSIEIKALKAASAIWHKHFPPHWRPEHLTGVAVSVAIDRPKKVAAENMLAHYEFVPPGVSFKVIISGKNAKENDIPYLLLALEQFNRGAITLGANTVNGWGRLKWDLNEIKVMTEAQIIDWIKSDNKPVGYNALIAIPAEEKEAYENKAAEIQNKILHLTNPPRLTLKMALTFDSPFLVNDPGQTGKGENLPDHAPLLVRYDKPFLPSKSIRGAFRSQAEKILRTIGKRACFPTEKPLPTKVCTPVLKKDDLANLCPACKLFGASGWQSPVEFSDFNCESSMETLQQEFVAIDRFTGGGAKSSKFNARFVYKPILTGELSVDLSKLETAGISDWALGLLALTLRDLIEGDITFGFGSSKGYGSAKAELVSIKLTGIEKNPTLKSILDYFEVSAEEINKLNNTSTLSDNVKFVVENLVEKFSDKTKQPL